MPMDPYQAARDAALPQLNGGDRDVTLNRPLIWAAVLAAGGSVTVHPADLHRWVEGTSALKAVVDDSGAIVMTAVGAAPAQ